MSMSPDIFLLRILVTPQASSLGLRVITKTWPRLADQQIAVAKWCLADVGLSTAQRAAQCAGQERAARWVTGPGIYAAFGSVRQALHHFVVKAD